MPSFELKTFSRGVSLLFHFHQQRYFDMSAASLLTSSALAGRAATTQRAVAARGDGANGVGGLQRMVAAFNGGTIRPLAASAAPLSTLQPHEQCRVTTGRASLVARASAESHGSIGEEEEAASASPPSNFTVKT